MRLATLIRRLCSTGVVGIILISSVALAGETFYLAPQGSDANSGTMASPWHNLAFAVTVAAPGDTIVMRGGTYVMDEVFIDRNKDRGGTAGNYLTIKAFPGEEPVLQYNSRRLIIWADYVRVEGLHFVMPWRCDAFGKGLQIVNNTFTGEQPKFGAIETGGTDILIEGNHIEIDDPVGNTRDHGIYVHKGERITIKDNTIIGTKGYGIHIYDEHKSPSSQPLILKDYVIEGNVVANSQERSGMIIAKGENNGPVTIENMLVHHNVFAGNLLYGLDVRKGDVDIKIYNNTFYKNGTAGLWIEGGVTAKPEIVNNIFEQHKLATLERSVDIHHLLVRDAGPEILALPGVVVGDPMFANPAELDFSLLASSPAIDAGTPIGLPFVGSSADLGAKEFNDSPTSIGDPGTQPSDFALLQNYPNPFNPETSIAYELSVAAQVNITIYDVIGRKIRTLVDESKAAGNHRVVWNGLDDRGQSVTSGLYYYKLQVVSSSGRQAFSQTRKMALVR